MTAGCQAHAVPHSLNQAPSSFNASKKGGVSFSAAMAPHVAATSSTRRV
ncbi:MAG: hypothetical protein GX571_05135 [Lentisphaerae bacterium]|jgi:hypothetical protein|nr:hypothetical protein [Lentisphaerota bacterium]